MVRYHQAEQNDLTMKLAQIEKIIDIYFEDEELNSSVNNFLERSGYSEKWLLYSDYCLDDHNKPNDVYASTFPHCSMKSSEYLWPKTKRLVKDERRSKSKLRVCA